MQGGASGRPALCHLTDAAFPRVFMGTVLPASPTSVMWIRLPPGPRQPAPGKQIKECRGGSGEAEEENWLASRGTDPMVPTPKPCS